MVDELCSRYGARLFDPQDSLQGNDVDLWIKPESVESIFAFVSQHKFVCERTAYSLIARRFVAGKLEVLDLIFSKSYFTSLFVGISVKDSALEKILSDRSLERMLRYVLLRRTDSSATQWLKKNADSVLQQYDLNAFFSPHIFVSGSAKLNRVGKILCAIGLMKNVWKRVGAGRVIAVTGPDGAGKTTIIDSIKTNFDVRVVYMGDWGFAGQKFYDRIMEGPRILNRLVYPFFYVENWFRLMRVYFYKFCGRLVISDRYPGTNRHLAKRESLYRMNNAMYALFPHPDQFVIISAPIDVIYARKQELNPQEIELLLTRLRKRLPKQKTTEIVNIHLDDSLNAFMRVMYGSVKEVEG